MGMSGRLRGLLAGLLAAVCCVSFPGGRAEGQTSPTSEQLQTFQGLTPEQQQAIRNALGTAGGAQSYGSYGAGERTAGGFSDTERLQRERNAEGGEESEPLVPVLRVEDWVIIEIDYQLPP